MENTNQLSNAKFLAYIRVSSKDQEHGTSLEQQKRMVMEYAQKNNFEIAEVFGETESASKTGRQIFDDMINRLRSDNLAGIIFHKVDRSARNPKDQALLYELMLEGYQLHFVSDNLSTENLQSRQVLFLLWGIASGYSENLKAEVHKGIMGRLLQGRLPNQSPLGYLREEECRSVIDPNLAPLVRTMFDEYATGKYTVIDLMKLTDRIGLVNRNGKSLDKNTVHKMLRNTFYYGVITHKKGVFQGEHEPLVTKELFDRVQRVLDTKGFKRTAAHKYVFHRLVVCKHCGKIMRSVTAPKAKVDHKYAWCRNKDCPNKRTVHEDVLNGYVLFHLRQLEYSDDEREAFMSAFNEIYANSTELNEQRIKALKLEISQTEARTKTLLDKYVADKIDEETYNEARKALVDRLCSLRDSINAYEENIDRNQQEIEEIGKLLINPSIAYQNADILNKQRLLKTMVENLSYDGEKLYITWLKPFDLIAKRVKVENCDPTGNRTPISRMKT